MLKEETTFATKAQLGLEMIRQAKANGMPFERVGCDTTYVRDSEFREALDTEGILYMGDIPKNLHVYTQKPTLGIPADTPGKRGRPHSRSVVTNGAQSVEVSTLAEEIALTPVSIRHSERGLLVYDCAARRVWTVTHKGKVREEWLLVRQESDGDFSFSLSNAHKDTPLSQLAYWRCERYFVERTFQDSKTEAGWDELVACKYRAWEHHTALNALAIWFIAETKLDWAREYPRDPELVHELELAVLPALSMSNIREMLKAVLPLNQLSTQEAIMLVIKHLVNRSRSTSSRLKSQYSHYRAQHQSRDP